MNKDNKKYWSRFSGIYDFIMKKDKKAYKQMIVLIKKELSQKQNMLEIATGTGLLAVSLADSVKHMEASDFSPEMIRAAKKKQAPANLNFMVQDACNLTYESKCFDVVLLSNALHIMPEPEKALDNIKRVLKEDGVLIAPTFLQKGSFKSFLFSKILAISGFKAFHKWNSREYLAFIQENGFQVIRKTRLKASFPIGYVVAKVKRE